MPTCLLYVFATEIAARRIFFNEHFAFPSAADYTMMGERRYREYVVVHKLLAQLGCVKAAEEAVL